MGFENFLACVTVLLRQRAAGRLLVPHAKLQPTLAALRVLGLSSRVAPYQHATAKLRAPAAYHEGHFVPAGGAPRGRAVLHVGISAEFAEGAQLAEAAQQHDVAGQLFGYPDCCSRFFAAAKDGLQDRTARSVPGLGPYPRDLNPVTPLLHGFPLLFHFPCSPTCADSLDLMRQRGGWLEALAPSFRQLRALGAGIALYHTQAGGCLVSRYRAVGDGSFLIDEMTAPDPARIPFLRATTRPMITLHGPHRWEIADTMYDDPRGFAAIFV
ncbi:MAG: hypothetical protein M3276_04145 [Actinomycetota bacterium]|nr:hypothetical protein [Actinomycetota bacterium]